jgi:hypothetical protein
MKNKEDEVFKLIQEQSKLKEDLGETQDTLE